MADRQIRVVYALIGIGLATGLSLLLGTPLRPSLSVSLWFEVLIWIVLAAFVVEPFFSGPSTALVNSISVVFVCLAARFQGPFGWWIVLLTAAGVAIACLIADLFVRDPSRSPTHITQRLARVFRQIGVTLGSWRFALVGALVLTLVSFNEPFSDPWVVSAVVLLYVFAVSSLEPHRLARIASGREPANQQLFAERILAPAELVLTGTAIDDLAIGDLLAIRGSGRTGDGVVLGPTYVKGRRGVRVYVADLGRLLHKSELEKLNIDVLDGSKSTAFDAYRAELQIDKVLAIGTVSEGSTMLELAAELFPDGIVDLGQVLWTLRGSERTYRQVVEARIGRESWGGDSHRCVAAQAIQLGHWDDSNLCFQSRASSPPHTDLVFAGPAAPGSTSVPPELHVFASIPNTRFPVAANLRELSLHHAALLGTTGTGKTHLAFNFAEALSQLGTKVICVDTTGQYSRRFPAPQHPQITLNGVIGFLNGAEQLAVFVPDPNEHTVREGKALAQAAFDWARSLAPHDSETPAKCLIIFEEAQNFVPEQFVVDDWNLKATAQDTSRIIMESRKFGLGFMLVSQRTAMVTKSALSQCNTVVAFQAVDQTGLDYLEGLCGRVLASGIPTLPQQTAITMGRGMASARPIIARIDDAPSVVN